jgi:hypothetical protein
LPSGGDIKSFFLRYLKGEDRTGINIVFSIEGAYVVRLKSKFMQNVEQERRGGIINVHQDISYLMNKITDLQQIQFRTNVKKSNIEKKLDIIHQYKEELEKITYKDVKIFDMFFYNYNIMGSAGIFIDTMIHSDIVYSTKQYTKIQSPTRVKTSSMSREPNARFNITPRIKN